MRSLVGYNTQYLKKDGALTGLTFSAVSRRFARISIHREIRGPRVAHSKFGPYFGFEPVPNGTPCLALRTRATTDSISVCATNTDRFGIHGPYDFDETLGLPKARA